MCSSAVIRCISRWKPLFAAARGASIVRCGERLCRRQLDPLAGSASDARIVLQQIEREPAVQPCSPRHNISVTFKDGVVSPTGKVSGVEQREALQGDWNHYYDRVIAALPQRDDLYLFGPGEAKGELQRRLRKTYPQAAAASMGTADKLTDRQIVAAVRKHFGKYGWTVATRDSTMDQRPVNRDS